MQRKLNFSAGPSALPRPVLEQVQAELLDWQGHGLSVMEMTHRGAEFESIINTAEADFRELMGIPSNYKVLFLQGGATQQFGLIPLNLMRGKLFADYLVTGSWSLKAISEANHIGKTRVVVDTKASGFTYAPTQDELMLSSDAAYVHYCSNETIFGVEFPYVPATGDIPLVADMSSHILSRPVDVSDYGLIYAGAQKNIGPVGLTIVIVRDDLLGQATVGIPSIFDYRVLAEHGSMYNTPPTFAIYVAGLVFKWLKESGGVAAIENRNIAKAKLLYDAIDSIDFYSNPVRHSDRSRMNVPFVLANPNLDAEFVKGAAEVGIVNIKGHKSVGGMRASIYNPIDLAEVQQLVDYMREFAVRHA